MTTQALTLHLGHLLKAPTGTRSCQWHWQLPGVAQTPSRNDKMEDGSLRLLSHTVAAPPGRPGAGGRRWQGPKFPMPAGGTGPGVLLVAGQVCQWQPDDAGRSAPQEPGHSVAGAFNLNSRRRPPRN